MFTIKTVTGGVYPATEYDEQNTIEHAGDQTDAITIAIGLPGTKDVFENGTRVARVHVDGGVDFAVSTDVANYFGSFE